MTVSGSGTSQNHTEWKALTRLEVSCTLPDFLSADGLETVWHSLA